MTRAALALVLVAGTAAADAPDDAPLASAASTALTRAELDERAHSRTVDLLRHLPGLHAFQVDGGGQAEAYLVRGFDARSGLDLAVTVDGVPVNAAGPGLDHGYADTQLVIADTVERVALQLGPYDVRRGDFATAGALDLTTLDELPGGGAYVRATTGAEPNRSVLVRARRLWYGVTGLMSPALASSRALIAAEVGIGDGPFVHPLRMRRGAVLAKWTYPLERGDVRLVANLFSGRAEASGLVPEAEIDAARIQPFGALDASLADTAMRASLAAGVTTTDTTGARWHAGGYAVAASHRSYTNPTGFLRDSVRGDQLELVDDRRQLGLDAWYRRDHALGQLRLGVQARADDGDAELWHADHRVRVDTCFAAPNPCLQATSHARDVAVYAEDTSRLGPATVHGGVRLDQLTWDAADAAPAAPAPASGDAARARISPKLGVLVEVAPGVELSALGGGGFRTSDTRAVIASDAVRGVPRIWAAELGARVHLGTWLTGGAAAYASRQDAEARWRADLQALEAVPRSRRIGLDANVTLAPTAWLGADASVAIARARTDDGAPVLLAPRVFGSAGVTARHRGSFVSLRGVGLGARRAAPDLATPAQLIFSAAAGTHLLGFELGVSVANLLDTRWRELEAVTTVRATRDAAPTTGLAAMPGEPLTVLVTVGHGV
jgi:hypothetical protein